jgi:hypothetical protein
VSAPITFESGTYVIIRVPPENWALLPSILQPRPNGYADRFIERDAAGYAIAPSKSVGAPMPTTSEATNRTDDKRWYCQVQTEHPRCFQAKSLCEYVSPSITCESTSHAYCFSARGRADWCYSTENDCIVAREEQGVTDGSGCK